MTISKQFALSGGESANDTSFTTSTFNSTGFTHLVAFVKHEGALATITMSDNKSSGTWNALTKKSHSNNDLHGQLFWVKIGSPGTGHTVTMTYNAARPWKSVGVWLINATGGDIELDTEAGDVSASPGTAVDAGMLSTSGASVVSFLGCCEYASLTWTPSSGWTEDYDGTGGMSTGGFSRGAETTTPIDPAATASTATEWVAVSAAFREVVAAGSQVLSPWQQRGQMGAQVAM